MEAVPCSAKEELAESLLSKLRFMDNGLRQLQDQIRKEGSILDRGPEREINPALLSYLDLSESYSETLETYLSLTD